MLLLLESEEGTLLLAEEAAAAVAAAVAADAAAQLEVLLLLLLKAAAASAEGEEGGGAVNTAGGRVVKGRSLEDALVTVNVGGGDLSRRREERFNRGRSKGNSRWAQHTKELHEGRSSTDSSVAHPK